MTRTAAAIRSIQALTIGTIVSHDARRRLDDNEKLAELDQQFQLPIAGMASDEPAWQEVEVEFDVVLLDAPDMRETPYSDPLATFGVVCPANVFVTVNVGAWVRNSQGDVTGALVRIGVHAPASDELVRFAGEVHLNFQGFGAPDYTDDTED